MIASWAEGQGNLGKALGCWQKPVMDQLPPFEQEKMSLGPFSHKRGTQTLVGGPQGPTLGLAVSILGVQE